MRRFLSADNLTKASFYPKKYIKKAEQVEKLIFMEEIRQIENELKQLEKKIETIARSFWQEARKHGKAKADYEIASATALLQIYAAETETGDKNTESVRKAMALKHCEKEYVALRIAEAEADSSKEVLRSLVSELSSVQTRAGLIKTEASLANYKT